MRKISNIPPSKQIHRITFRWPIVACFGFLASVSCYGGTLSRGDAEKLLSHMGYKNAKVVAIVQGTSVQGAQFFGSNTATVISLSVRDKGVQSGVDTFYYDEQVVWFYFEWREGGPLNGYKNYDHFRLWATDGYKKVTLDATE